jgi:pimeloyl-ACP methyl ester carboxylesterase
VGAKPVRSKGYPAIIYNHGSVACPDGDTSCSHAPAPPCSIISYFVSKNYAVFTPRRRGYGDSTGTYNSDWVDFLCGGTCGPLRPVLGTLELQSEAGEVKDAFHFLQSFATVSGVNASKVAIMGHSLGGIVSVFANTEAFGPLETLAIAAGSESWCGNDVLAGALTSAAGDAQSPTYYFEPKNDVDLSPTIELARAAGIHLARYDSAVYGPVRDAAGDPLTCGKEAHVCFTKDANEVKRWGPAALEFLKRYGVK